MRHDWHGVLVECDCLAEAHNQISDREDEGAADQDAYDAAGPALLSEAA